MFIIYIINIVSIAVFVGLSIMLLQKAAKRKSALMHYFIPCSGCGRKTHMTFGFFNLAAFKSDIKAKCLLDKSHTAVLDKGKYKETGEIRTSFCWYIFLAIIAVIVFIFFVGNGMLFIMEIMPGKSIMLVLMLLSAIFMLFSLIYYYYCRSMQTVGFCFNEVGTEHTGKVMHVNGKEAAVQIGDATINGVVFSKFRGYDKAGEVKIYVTLPDVTPKESEVMQAAVEYNANTKMSVISGILDVKNALIHSSIDFMIDPYKAEAAAELDGKYVRVVVPQIGMDIRRK